MAVVTHTYDHTFDLIGAGTVKEGDTFKAILLNNSFTFTATNTLLTQINTNEVANGNGYTTGGVTLSSVVLLNGAPGSPWKIDFDDLNPGWTASGGSIGPYRWFVIYDDTVTSPADAILWAVDLDDTPGTFTAADGAQIKITLNASGFATITES